ncbi:MAG TPA: hypothetical protein VHW03_03680 [Chthoniobacterales bacterium]|jgi:hypothetical protein|nr:hypothetical protein [Chthoniobacterales bacterium]
MHVSFKNGFYAGLLAAFILGIWLVQLWNPENQVRLHSENLLARVEARSLSGAGDFVAANYRDDWGDDRAQMVTRLRLISRLVNSLTISADDVQTQVAGPTGTWRARLHVAAQGEAAAEITERVNGLTTPFLLRWQRESWKPWDWQLVEISNPELQIPRGDF